MSLSRITHIGSPGSSWFSYSKVDITEAQDDVGRYTQCAERVTLAMQLGAGISLQLYGYPQKIHKFNLPDFEC